METFLTDIGIDINHFYLHFIATFVAWVCVIIAVLIDLLDGIHTAKYLKQRIHSHKLRVTIDKLGSYWAVMMLGFVADLIVLFLPWYGVPYVTIAITVIIISIEVKSVFEHARRRKDNTAKIPDTLRELAEYIGEKELKRILVDAAHAKATTSE
jgi:ABC-type phosphate transport system permease subunit